MIRLPRGTVITVGEEKQVKFNYDVKSRLDDVIIQFLSFLSCYFQEVSKPGRKRKGDMIIKEVKIDTPKKRQRRKPSRFQQSPDKHLVKNAIRAARNEFFTPSLLEVQNYTFFESFV